jgi:hypothetical protein
MINEGWAIVCMIGFWGWVLSVIGFILKAFPGRGFHGRNAAVWGGAILSFFCIWFLGMLNA